MALHDQPLVRNPSQLRLQIQDLQSPPGKASLEGPDTQGPAPGGQEGHLLAGQEPQQILEL